MNKQPPIAAIRYTEIMESGLWNSLNFLKNHSVHINARTHAYCLFPAQGTFTSPSLAITRTGSVFDFNELKISP